ncbi:MAG TPA: CoA ester lyase [Stellaceae bacterium]|nr:CoA ester lyase [Stellaceae bacterium]
MTLRPDLPVWRSLLFVPVIAKKFVDGAAWRGADAIILDLEDSVPLAEKPRARALLQEAAEIVARGGADVLVRINRPLRHAIPDIEAAVSPRVHALALPKVESANHLRLLCEVIDEIEAERGMTLGSTKLLAMVETAEAFFEMPAIARAHPRVVALTLGAEDFSLSVGMLPEAEGLFFPKQQMIIAARSAGVLPLGFLGTVADFRDLAAFRATVQRSRRLGFLGAACVHPSQISILNEEYAPQPDDVVHAERVVAAYEKATAQGVGAITVDGKMIDVPVVERAQALLARHRAIEARITKRTR